MATSHQHLIRGSRLPNGEERGSAWLCREDFWRQWREHEPLLLGICLKWMNGDQSEAREALSSAMMRAVEGSTPAQLSGIGNVGAWFATLVTRHCIDLKRARQRAPHSSENLEELLQRLEVSGLPKAVSSPETELVCQESYQRIWRVIESLPERLRDVMVLRASLMPFKEIALNLSITPAAARKRAEQARILLRQRLMQDDLNEARSPRRPHDAGFRPDTERRAADAILQRPTLPKDCDPPRHAHPRIIRLEESRAVEDLIFLTRKPVRIAQRLATLEDYMRRHPGGWTRPRTFADLLVLQGRLGEAVPVYRVALDRQPRLFGIYESLAACLMQLGHHAGAGQTLLQGLPLVKDRALKAHVQALLAVGRGESETATEAWEQAVAHSGGQSRYLRALIRHHLEMSRSDAARQLLDPYRKQQPRDREAVHLALCAASATDDHRLFSDTLTDALRHFPKDALLQSYELIDRIGRRHISKSEYQEISRKISQLKGKLRGHSAAVHLQACWLYHRGRDERCATLVIDYVSENPFLREALKLAAHWTAILGQQQQADIYLQALSAKFPRLGDFRAYDIDSLWLNP